MTKLIVDGQIYSYQRYGGVTRIIDTTIPIMCEQKPGLSVEIVTSQDIVHSIPQHPHISRTKIPLRVFRIPRLRSFGRRIEPPINRKIYQETIKRHYQTGNGAIWHSLFYQVPKKWSGPVIVTVLDMAFERFAPLFSSTVNRWFVKNKRDSLARADAVICISEATRADVLEFCNIPPSKIHVVHLACDSLFKEYHCDITFDTKNSKASYLLHLGNRSLNKNFPRLLKAFSIWEMRNSVPLVVVGREWSQQEKQMLTELGIETNVENIGYVEDDKLARLYCDAAAFVYPSIYEGFGIPLLEAMACGCPIVASDIPSSVEVAGDVPIYFDPNKTEALRDALDLVLFEGRNSDRTLKGKVRATRFTWERTALETLKVYDSYL